MFNNPFLADVNFVVGEGPDQQTIPAHKYVLATGSSVFCAMLYGDLASKDVADIITIPDVEPETFHNLLRSVVLLFMIK